MHHESASRSGTLALLMGAAIVLVTACSADGMLADMEEEAEAILLAEITTADGVAYTFMEMESGDVAVEVQASHLVDPSQLPGPDTSVAELYQRISGHPAPEALVLAERRADANRSLSRGAVAPGQPQPEPGNGVEDGLPQEVRAQTRQMTAQEFQSRYCPGGYDFLYCWPYRAGNPWVQQNSTYFAGAMYAMDCNTRFRYQYYDAGSWKTFQDRFATTGQHWWYWMSGSRTARRWEILGNSSSCGIHFSVWGNY